MTQTTPPTRTDDTLKGIGLACLAFFLLTIMQGFNKALVGAHHPIEVGFYRNFLSFLVSLAYILSTRKFDAFRTTAPVLLFFRAFIGTSGLVITFAATQTLPLSDATVIFFFSTLLTPILAHFVLHETVGIYRWSAIAIGMSGVILVAQPQGAVTIFGVGLALTAATTHSLVAIMLRRLRFESSLTVTFYFFAFGAVSTGLLMPWFFKWPSFENALYLGGVALTGGLAQLVMTRSYQLAPASLLAPFGYTALIWAVAMDMLIWGYLPGWSVYIGAALIICAKLFILYRETVNKKIPDTQ